MPSQSRRTNTRSKIYFFSDVHLGLGTDVEDRARERRVVSFLSQVLKDGRELFIVGDLFDYWFEYNSVIPRGYSRLFGALAAINDAGIPITYLAGNHDFWLKSYLSEEFGVKIYENEVERMFNGKKFYIHHGDGLYKEDVGYRVLKRVLRSKMNIWLFSLLHPDFTARIARWSSRKSRKHTSNVRFEGNDMVNFAEAKIRQGFDYVLMGHNHQPLHHPYQQGAYVNLGNWIDKYTYAVFDGKKLSLNIWG
jgi:UDP-2,3-diacylglucosamine hydrolase